MSKLVDKERLAKLAKALDDRAKAAVAAEKERAMEVEADLQADIDAINHAENGILAQAKAHVATEIGKLDAGNMAQDIEDLKAEDVEIRKEFAAADAALKAELQGEIDADVKVVSDALADEKNENKEGSLAAKVKAAQADIDAFQEAQATKEQEQDAAIAAKVAQADYNAKVKALEDKDAELVKAIGDEEARAKEVEEDFEARIAANEAFVAAQPAIDAEQDRRIKALEDANKDGGAVKEAIDGVAQDLADFIGEQADADAAQDAEIAKKVDATAYNAKVQELEGKNNTQDQAIAGKVAQSAYDAKMEALDAEDADIRADFAAADSALDGRLDVIEGEGEGSVKKALADAKKYADEKIQALDAGALEARVKANEDKLVGLEETTVQASINKAEQDAKDYADQKITALVDSAPDAMNTLNELAEAIKGNKNVYDAYVAEHATAMSTMKSELQAEIDSDIAAARTLISAEIDADVKGEADRAKAEEADIRADFAAADAQVLVDAKKYADDQDAALKTVLQKEIDDDVKVEKERAMGVEAELLAAINAKVSQTDYNAKVANFEGRIAANEAFVAAHDHSAIEGDITALEGKVQTLEGFMNGHSHTAIEKGIADNKAAIEKEVEDRDAAIEEALKSYSDTEAVKSMLTAVVNSLSMEMEDNKLKLTLGGGSSAITLKEVSLDMATDDDIQGIIDGLDA